MVRKNEKRQEVDLRGAIGNNLRHFRDRHTLRQSDISDAAQQLGFDWERATVAQIEAGTRQLRAAELLALPLIVGQALMRDQDPEHVGVHLSLSELVAPPEGSTLALSDVVHLSGEEVERWLGGTVNIGYTPTRRLRPTETERKAADRLGIPVEDLLDRAQKQFGRTFESEREARVNAMEAVVINPADRGHISRRLIEELSDEI